MKDISSLLKFSSGSFYGFLDGKPNEPPSIRYSCQIQLNPLHQKNYGTYHPTILLEGFSSSVTRYTDIVDLPLSPELQPEMYASLYLENHYEPDLIEGKLSYAGGRFFDLDLRLKLRTPDYMVIKASVDGEYRFRIPYSGLRINPSRFFPKPDTPEALTSLAATFVDLDLYLPPRSKGKVGWKLSPKPWARNGA